MEIHHTKDPYWDENGQWKTDALKKQEIKAKQRHLKRSGKLSLMHYIAPGKAW